jgi:hypothetical protein
MRNRLVAVMLIVAGLVFIPAAAAVAQSDSSTPGSLTATTTVPPISIPPDGVDIGGGEKFTGAVVTLNGDASSPRTMNAYQAAVFVQSWLPDALFNQKLKLQDPPAQLPVYRVDVNGTWGEGGTSGTVAVYYASDGTNVWVSFPSQEAAPAPISPPPPSNWFVALPRVIDAFNGNAVLEQTEGVEAATAPTLPPGEAKSSGSSGSSSTAIWVALLVGVVIVLVVGGFILRRRRSSTTSDPATEDTKARVDAP